MSGRHILIVDDNAMNVEMVSYILETADFTVASAMDAMAAKAMIPAFQPDLILMDIQMPGMDGLALTRELKGDPGTSHIAIVAFTAYAMKGDEARMRASGCDGYISKPINIATFASEVQAALSPSPLA